MFRRIIYFLLLSSVLLNGQSIKDISNKINKNKTQIKDVTKKKKNINKTLNNLAKKIIEEEKKYNKIVSILETTNNQIMLNKMKLDNALNKVEKLKEGSSRFKQKKKIIEKNVIDFVIQRYAMTMGIEQIDKESLEDAINKEVYTLIFENVKQEILNLNIKYLTLITSIRKNERKIKKYSQFINKQQAIKEKYKNLIIAQEKSLERLKQQHETYQKHIKKLIAKQNKLTDLLGHLNILKKKEIKKEEQRIRRAKALARKQALEKKRKKELAKKKTKKIKFKKRSQLDDKINIEVKKLGSSTKGIKISKYRGLKTIPPLKSYTVVKKFGKYYDKVYKMELFNESVSLKTKIPNAKVVSVFRGKIVYAKKNSGLLENVVIVKHKNNLHTIYSHLDQISPTLKVGKWIPKGYVVGRVNDTLQFQATKDSKYINPLRLIKKEKTR
jgi:murein DD-endopeptidase MepM/ murein hydrolase activator NlpD